MEADEKLGDGIKCDTKHLDGNVGGLGLGEIELQEEKKGETNKMLRSWKDVARRARLFEYCNVENPNEEPADLNDEDATEPGQSVDGGIGIDSVDGSVDGRVKEIDHHETRPRKQSVSNPFNFPQKPIEQIEMLRNEVNLERQGSLDTEPLGRSPSHSFRLLHNLQDVPATILEERENDVIEEEEVEKLQIPLPLFQRLSLLGDNSSGVIMI